MRRGLIGWSAEEEPEANLAARKARVEAELQREGLAALLVYTDLSRPAAVSRLSHFIPYWNRGILLVVPGRPLTLVCALSNRVSGWIRQTSALDDVICTQNLPAAILAKLRDAGIAPGAALGVVEMAAFPQGVLDDIVAGLDESRVVDATEAFEAALAAAPGPGQVLVEQALAVGRAALSAARDTFRHPSDGPAAIAAAERAARDAGAEEVLIGVAPDAVADPLLRRVEGAAAFGGTMFLRVSLAYKGHWYRIGTTLQVEGATTAAYHRAAATLHSATVDAKTQADPGALPRAVAEEAGGDLRSWSLEGPWGGLPLAPLADSSSDEGRRPKGLLSLTVRLDFPEGPWYGAAPLTLS